MIRQLFNRPHEMEEGQGSDITQRVVGEAAFCLDGLYYLIGAFAEFAFFIQGQGKPKARRVHQGVETTTVGHAVGYVTDRGHVDAGLVGVDVTGQPAAGNGFYNTVPNKGVNVDQARWRFQGETLPPFPLGDNATLQNGRGGTDGVGTGVNRISHHFHDDITGDCLGVCGRHQQVHGHFRDAVGLFQ